MDKVNSKFHCNICDKYYKSQSSLCNHNKKFHPKNPQKNTIITQKSTFLPQNNTNIHNINKLICSYCSKKYSRTDSLNRHYKTCKVKINIEMENIELKKENEKLKINFQKEIDELKNQLKELMNKNCKIHYKTLQKINSQQNIQNQNNIQNNINIIGFNNENLIDLFTEKEKLKILGKKFNSLNYLIEYTHFNNKYPQLKNIKITNLKDNVAYKYDNKKNKFIATTKDELINDLVISRMTDIDEFQTEVFDKLSLKEQQIIKKMLDDFYDDEIKYSDNKKDEIKFIIYNNSENS
jgi:hypothetical protein